LRDPDGRVRGAAAGSLASVGAAGPEVIGLLMDEDPGTRLAAAKALAAQGGFGIVDRLIEFAFAFDGMHRREAARLLAALNRAEATRGFLEILRDPGRKRCWRAAIDAVEELHRSHTASGTRMVA
jgi:HEAT repeat protein